MRSEEDFFQAILLGSFQTCSGFTGAKKKSQLDPACSVKEHRELSTALELLASTPG